MTDIFDRELSDLDEPEPLFEVDTDEAQPERNGNAPDFPGLSSSPSFSSSVVRSSSSFTSYSANDWPAPPSADAFLGLAGDIVRTIEPYSEAGTGLNA